MFNTLLVESSKSPPWACFGRNKSLYFLFVCGSVRSLETGKNRISFCHLYLSRRMIFPTMWYVRPAKPQISLGIRAVWSEPFASRLNILSVKLLTEYHLKFLSFKGGCTGSSESTLVKMPHCWKSHVVAHFYFWCLTHDTVQSCHKARVVFVSWAVTCDFQQCGILSSVDSGEPV